MSAVLAKRQRWLYDAIVDDAAPKQPERILAGAAVPAEVGLSVYRHAYRARLRECVADDFAAVAQVLGERAFTKVSDAFIAAHPPCDATLNAYGRFFAPWLTTTRIPRQARLTELARLEWALVEALHAPLAPALSGGELAGVAPQAWGTITLRVAPSLRLLPTRYNTNAQYEAFRTKRPAPPVRRMNGSVVVIRQRDGLQRFTLDALETRVLGALATGDTLGAALGRLAAQHTQTIQHAFTRWVAQGYFTALG
ncbi:MAG TPA: DNA-binding domain-containing protein [Planctomycetota bacterium]|jgi:hypothetical protein|nr:DNA-binding domain-containing protein [Planctomycetota bacterium]